MAKFNGIVGYVTEVETEPGVWKQDIVEKPYSGELLKNFVRRENQSAINDSTNISNTVSFVADPYAREHVFDMQYLKFIYPNLGGAWKIESVDVSSLPRLSVSLGGKYNGQTRTS